MATWRTSRRRSRSVDRQFGGRVVDGLVLCRLPPAHSGDRQFEGRVVDGLVLYRLPLAAVIGKVGGGAVDNFLFCTKWQKKN